MDGKSKSPEAAEWEINLRQHAMTASTTREDRNEGLAQEQKQSSLLRIPHETVCTTAHVRLRMLRFKLFACKAG